MMKIWVLIAVIVSVLGVDSIPLRNRGAESEWPQVLNPEFIPGYTTAIDNSKLESVIVQLGWNPFHKIRDIAKDFGHKVEDLGKKIGHEVKEAEEKAVHGIVDAAHEVAHTAEGIGKDIAHTGKDVGENIKHVAEEAGQGIKQTAEDVGHEIKGTAEKIGNDVAHTAVQVGDKVKHVASDALRKVITMPFWEKLKEAATHMDFNSIKNWLNEQLNSELAQEALKIIMEQGLAALGNLAMSGIAG